MEQVQRLASICTLQDEEVPFSTFGVGKSRPTNNVTVLAPSIDSAAIDRTTSKEISSAGKWPGLLKRVRGAAHYIREVEDRAQEQELRVQELLEQVQADMQEASAKIQDAEQRARDVQVHASKLIQAAEERANMAEKRAAVAEAWLIQISQTIETEFVIEPAVPKQTGTISK
ncbi:hypothetical protein [Methylobacterium sp. E-066]|uniref:hypothetical protein n=1 Tax=Methylobacterium sp. E-066 TaxID=2836584 RepID=UPI001FB90FA4|nr:hypothetical protein [Methylobacterium sp. E-066]MCJ2140422.1 hypothetical protein [Methylobacterium sp. E-066]